MIGIHTNHWPRTQLVPKRGGWTLYPQIEQSLIRSNQPPPSQVSRWYSSHIWPSKIPQARCPLPVSRVLCAITYLWTFLGPGLPIVTMWQLTNHHVKNSRQFAQFIATQNLADTYVLVFWWGLFVHTCAYCPCFPDDIWLVGERPLTSWKDRPTPVWMTSATSLASSLMLSDVRRLDLLTGPQNDDGVTSVNGCAQPGHGRHWNRQPCTPSTHTHFLEKVYVDNTCTALPLDLVDSFHQHLNSVGPNIQFTVQKVKDGQLPYLDMLLIWGLRWLHQHFRLPKSNTQISTWTSSHTNWWLTSRQLSGLWSAGVKVFLHQKWGK